MKKDYAATQEGLAALGAELKPKAILIVSGHWEEDEFTVATSAAPGMIYDYGGFPPHTYQIIYPAPGAPEVAMMVKAKLEAAGIVVREDSLRGFDHGVFVPLYCLYPHADIPIAQLSMKRGYSVEEHVRVGKLLEGLRDEGVMVIGSGLSYHDLRRMFTPGAGAVSAKFEQWLTSTVEARYEQRMEDLLRWESAPAGREAHPREDHLVPLFVAAGAGGEDVGQRVILDHTFGIEMASYRFG